MNDFWNNLFRYPRFFISSLLGLIMVLLAPFINLFKIKKFKYFVPLLGFFSIITVITIIKNMVGL